MNCAQKLAARIPESKDRRESKNWGRIRNELGGAEDYAAMHQFESDLNS